jgi:hypothetical protein
MNMGNAGARERDKAMGKWKSGLEPLTNERLQELAEAWGSAVFWMVDARTAPPITKHMVLTGRGLAEHALDEYFRLLERHIPQ